jgi:hypothetical protein
MDGASRRAAVTGVLGGLAGVHVSLVGMVATFQARDLIAGIVTVGTTMPMMFVILAGWIAARPRAVEAGLPSSRTLRLGVIAGVAGGLVMAALCLLVVAVDVRWILVNARPQLAETLQFGRGPVLGSLILVAGGGLLGLAGAALHVLPSLTARALTIGAVITVIVALMEPFLGAVLRNLSLDLVEDLLYASGGLTAQGFVLVFALVAGGVYAWGTRGDRARERVAAMPAGRQRAATLIFYAALVGLLLLLPLMVGQRQ